MEQLRKKLQNFWFYYKIPLLVALSAVLVLSYLGIQKRNTMQPDYHIGLVRQIPCTDAALQALKDTFTAAGEDRNGDGQVLVQIHTYYVNLSDDTENAGVRNAEVVQALDADLIGGVSGIFLLEDVDTFQRITNNLLSGSAVSVENGLWLTVRKDADEPYRLLVEKIN